MTAHILRRLVTVPFTLILLSLLIFLMIRAIPGDAVDVRLQNAYSPERAAELRAELGIDEPIWKQYPTWLINLLRGDLGRSFVTNQPINDEVVRRLPVTLELMGLSLVIQLTIGIPAGIIAAAWKGRPADQGIRLVSIVVLAVPSFWIGTLVFVLPSIWFNWSPRLGYVPFLDQPIENLKQFIVPAAIIGLYPSAIVLRLTRVQMLDVLGQDYVRTARSKGLSSLVVLRRHALRNALLPVITFIGITVSSTVAGAVVIETIFALPGLGRYGVDAVQLRDYPALQAFVLVTGATFLLVNLLIDVSYAFIDPRIRVS